MQLQTREEPDGRVVPVAPVLVVARRSRGWAIVHRRADGTEVAVTPVRYQVEAEAEVARQRLAEHLDREALPRMQRFLDRITDDAPRPKDPEDR